MHKVRFTREARADLEHVTAYTLDRFGVQQAQKYRLGFARFFEIVPEHPQVGADQSDIEPGLRRLVHQSHTIYHRVVEGEILIARILGAGQDPLQEF